MDEQQAEALAKILNGETWNSGGGIWLVIKHTEDGRVISMTDESVVEYQDETAFEDNLVKASIYIL